MNNKYNRMTWAILVDNAKNKDIKGCLNNLQMFLYYGDFITLDSIINII